VRVVAGSGNRAFDVFFATQRAAGTYTLKVGPNVRDAHGSLMTVYQTSHTIASAPSVATLTASSPLAINPHGTAVSLLPVGQDVAIADVNVRVNITFPHDGDLVIHLQAPDGTDVLLARYAGGTSQNFQNTVFDDSSANFVALGWGPFAGVYQPLAPLAALKGKDARGTWKLWVENQGSFRGTLNNWSLIVKRAA
jgi:subtilisin-like proprotein convertase family protein